MIDKLGGIYYDEGEFPKAVDAYRKLSLVSSNRRDSYIAIEGLMLCHYQLGSYDSTLSYADMVISAEWKPRNAVGDAQLIKARSYIRKGNIGQAQDEVIKVVNQGSENQAAEALYVLAQLFSENGDLLQSNETLFRLIGNYGSFKQWTDPAYLMIADNYINLGEILQAEATVNSVIENSANVTLVKQAKEKLLTIKGLQQNVLEADSDFKPDSSQ